GGFVCPAERAKPWGTGQAVWAARNAVDTPFAVINADDFYGRDAYAKLAGFLREADPKSLDGAIAAFTLSNTLSENGSVSRGICTVSADGFLKKVVENTNIFRRGGKVVSELADGESHEFCGDEPVSMNAWGFTPALFGELERMFTEFLRVRGGELKSEFYLPSAADELICTGRAKIHALTSADRWFGVTYREDKPVVMAELGKLVAAGKYPEKLFA
ncbi:MAG: hypothetical protein PHI35_03525, partial [Victivallaceae bacterium]|nr:hypothetical protein [Victivallaceae bacterium]